jgi:hypothetical protein
LQKQVGLLDYPKPVSHVVAEEKEGVRQDFFGNIKINKRERDSVTAVFFHFKPNQFNEYRRTKLLGSKISILFPTLSIIYPYNQIFNINSVIRNTLGTKTK